MRFRSIPTQFCLVVASWIALAPAAAAQTVDLEAGALSTSNPALTTLPGGHVLAVWARDRRVPQEFGGHRFIPDSLVFQRRDNNLAPAGPIVTILPPGDSATVVFPQVSATATGVQFVWARAGEGRTFVIEGRVLSGSRLRPRIVLGGCEVGELRGVRLVPAPSGWWLIWNQACGAFRILAQRLDALGRPVGEPREVTRPAAQASKPFDAAPLIGGGFVAVWVQTFHDNGETTRQLTVQAFAGNGIPLAPAFRAAPDASHLASFAVTTTPAGLIQVAWPSQYGPGITMRRFDVDGVPMELEQGVGSDGFRNLRFAKAPKGDILIWQTYTSGCFARFIDRVGPRGTEQRVNGLCTTATVTGNRVVTGWQGFGPIIGSNSSNLARARSLPFPFLH